MADGQGSRGPGRGSWLLGRATVGGAVIGAITAAIGVGPVGVAEGFASGESATHAFSELKFAMAAPLVAVPGAAVGLAVGILVGIVLALFVPHVPVSRVRVATPAITTGVIVAVAFAMGIAAVYYKHDAVNGLAAFIEWGLVPAIIALPFAVSAASRLARAYLASDFSEVLPLVVATDPSAPSRVFSAVFGTSLGVGAILGAISAMLATGPIFTMYSAAGTHNWPWRDLGASIILGSVFAPYAAPVGAIVGLVMGLLCGVLLGSYAVRARRSRSPIDVARKFRLLIATTITGLAVVVAPVTAPMRSDTHDLLRTVLAFTGIPLVLALILAMIGASWVRRAYFREEVRPLPEPIAWLNTGHVAAR